MYAIIDRSGYLLVEMDEGFDVQEIRSAIDSLIGRPDFPLKNDLWYFKGPQSRLRYDDLESITRHIQKSYPREATRTKTALVANSGLVSALGRIWVGSVFGRLPYDARVFDSIPEAERWLTSPDP